MKTPTPIRPATILLRNVPGDLHRAAKAAAALAGLTLTAWVLAAIRAAVKGGETNG